MEFIHNFDPLFGVSSTGKYKEWRISVIRRLPSQVFLLTTYGYIDGSKQTTEKRVFRKNVGRANETTPEMQGILEAKSSWQKKYDEGYRTSLEELKNEHLPFLPMLALRYQDRKHNINWPCYVQPKLNGVRCIAEKIDHKTVIYWSRKGKKYLTLDTFTSDVLEMLEPGERLDGEIYNPDLTFQDITKRVKRVLSSRTDIEHTPVQFHLFDIILNKNLPYNDRATHLIARYSELIFKNPNTLLTLVPTYKVQSEREAKEYHNQFAEQGYEGTMFRNMTGLYKSNYRSADLQKYKDFIDEEFTIVGGHEGQGKDEQTIIFECITKDGAIFSVRPKGSWEQRNDWWRNLEFIIGKQLTVRYQNLSDDGVPIFPVGITIRDYE